MALAPHLYTLAFGLAARKKEGETEVRGKEENDGETDTWSTHPKKEQGGGIKPERFLERQRNLCVVAWEPDLEKQSELNLDPLLRRG